MSINWLKLDGHCITCLILLTCNFTTIWSPFCSDSPMFRLCAWPKPSVSFWGVSGESTVDIAHP